MPEAAATRCRPRAASRSLGFKQIAAALTATVTMRDIEAAGVSRCREVTS
jgi:hypothetical protein